MESIEPLLSALRAAAEPTRLRLLALCAHGELTVSELVGILGQSQPRVSRHLKLLTEAGLLERIREGSWVFHRQAQEGAAAHLAEQLNAMLPDHDGTLARDLERLSLVKNELRRSFPSPVSTPSLSVYEICGPTICQPSKESFGNSSVSPAKLNELKASKVINVLKAIVLPCVSGVYDFRAHLIVLQSPIIEYKAKHFQKIVPHTYSATFMMTCKHLLLRIIYYL